MGAESSDAAQRPAQRLSGAGFGREALEEAAAVLEDRGPDVTPFRAAVDAIFADPHVVGVAVYRAGGAGPGESVRIIRSAPDDVAPFAGGRWVVDTVLIDVRVAEVAELEQGDTFLAYGELLEVISEPRRDALGLVWQAEAGVRPVDPDGA